MHKSSNPSALISTKDIIIDEVRLGSLVVVVKMGVNICAVLICTNKNVLRQTKLNFADFKNFKESFFLIPFFRFFIFSDFNKAINSWQMHSLIYFISGLDNLYFKNNKEYMLNNTFEKVLN